MGLGRDWATLSRLKIFYFAFKLIFKNRDGRLGKIFSDNFRKIKIGINKIIFAIKNMRCDDADVMMMQK